MDIYHTISLLELVVAEAEDREIWNAVLDLIAGTKLAPSTRTTTAATTPPDSLPAFASSVQQTPWSFNTGSFADTSQNREQVDDVLRAELKVGLRIDVPDLFQSIFRDVPRLDELAEVVFCQCQEGDAPLYKEDCGWVQWPLSAEERLVLDWLHDHTDRYIDWIKQPGLYPLVRRRVYRGPSLFLDGSKRKMDVGIAAEAIIGVEKEDLSAQALTRILVTGELKSNPADNGYEITMLDLATYAREIFGAQDRRFVLGFTLCGSIMRLWQFDRLGSSGSQSFDINEDGFKFVRTMLGFLLMDDEQLGFDPTVHLSDGQKYIEIVRDGHPERLILTEVLKKQAVIAGRATTCWKAYREGDDSKKPLIVKDSWQYPERPEEGELVRDATERGVQNIARYYHHETVQIKRQNDDIITNVRGGLMNECGRTTFRQRSFIEPEAPLPAGLRNTAPERAATEWSPTQSILRKRSSSSAQMTLSPSKKSRTLSSRRSKPLETPSHNRVRRRLITQDPGKPIEKATSLVTLLSALIGAIKGTFHNTTRANSAYVSQDTSLC